MEGAGDHRLDYLGYVEAEVHFLHPVNITLDALLIVVPDGKFHRDVPLLIGTNLLQLCMKHGFSNENPTEEWDLVKTALTCMEPVSRVHTTKAVTIPAHGKTVIHGFARFPLQSRRIKVLTEAPKDSSLPGGLLIDPCYHDSGSAATSRVPVRIQNFSAKDVTIPAKTSLCDLHPVSLVERVDMPQSSTKPTESSDGKNAGLLPEKLDLSHLRSELSSDQMKQVEVLLQKYSHVFSKHDLDLGHTDRIKHNIKLHDDTPFKERHRRIPPAMYEEVRNHLREMLDLGAIRESNSPFASPVVLVRKKDGALRFCVDFRRLNSKTQKDAYSLPRIEETLDVLQGAKWFSSLDLKSSYWQVEISEEDKHKTAFTVGPLGFYECNSMAFGLTNAPATFQRLMEAVMGDLHLMWCLIYLDDIIVFSKTFDEHLERLEAIFLRLEEAGLKLKPSKCQLLKHRIKYLGHIVSEDGIIVIPFFLLALYNVLAHLLGEFLRFRLLQLSYTGLRL